MVPPFLVHFVVATASVSLIFRLHITFHSVSSSIKTTEHQHKHDHHASSSPYTTAFSFQPAKPRSDTRPQAGAVSISSAPPHRILYHSHSPGVVELNVRQGTSTSSRRRAGRKAAEGSSGSVPYVALSLVACSLLLAPCRGGVRL